MPTGQFTGPRDQYVYTTDTGAKYVLTLDADLAGLSGGLTVFDPAAPGAAVPAPRRFRPRGVYWQGTAAGYTTKRKFLVAGTPSDPIYASNTSQAITIDGVAGRTTGRRGERLSF